MSISEIFDEAIGDVGEIEEGDYLGELVRVGFRVRTIGDREQPGFTTAVVPTGGVSNDVADELLKELGTQYIDLDIRRPRTDTKAHLQTLADIGVKFEDGEVSAIAHAVDGEDWKAIEKVMAGVQKRIESPLPVQFSLKENVKATNPLYRFNARGLTARVV